MGDVKGKRSGQARIRARPPRDFAQKERSGTAMMAPTCGKHRLLRLVSPFVAVVLFQALLAGLSLETLSSVRAYVGGEGMWSKGQKDAIHFISLYSQTGDEQFFGRFKVAVAVPLADRAARYALEQRTPDLNAARDGFLGGRKSSGRYSWNDLAVPAFSRRPLYGDGDQELASDGSVSG